jgi:hypothetical protein
MGRETTAITPFDEWFRDYDRGRMNDETTQALAALTEAVHLYGKAGKGGKLSIIIDVKPNGTNSVQMKVTADVSIKAPTADRPETLYFYDSESGSLLRDDPLQPKLPLRRADENEGDRGGLRRVRDEERED